MNGIFWISYGLLWGCVLVLLMLMLLIYRQVGLVYLGSRHSIEHGGIAVGAAVPDIEITPLAGEQPAGLSSILDSDDRPALVLFSLPVCPLCHEIAANLPPLLSSWSSRVRFVWLERAGLEKIPDRFGDTPGIQVFVADHKAYAAFDIRGAPYVYLATKRGAVLERGLVNTAEDIEHLLRSRVSAAANGVEAREVSSESSPALAGH